MLAFLEGSGEEVERIDNSEGAHGTDDKRIWKESDIS